MIVLSPVVWCCMKTTNYILTIATSDGKRINIKFNGISMVDKVIVDLQTLRRWIKEDDRLESLYKGDTK